MGAGLDLIVKDLNVRTILGESLGTWQQRRKGLPETDNCQRCSACNDEETQEELLKRGEAIRERILWRELSFHWCNRSEGLASPSEVVTLMDDVDYVGVGYKALLHVLCARAEPGNT